MKCNLHETLGSADDKRLSPVEFVLHRSTLNCSAGNKGSPDLHKLVFIPCHVQFDCMVCVDACVCLINKARQVNRLSFHLYQEGVTLMRQKFKIISLEQFYIQWLPFQIYILSLFCFAIDRNFPKIFSAASFNLRQQTGISDCQI